VSEGAVGVEEKSDVRMARVSKVLGRTGSRGGVTQVSGRRLPRAAASVRTAEHGTDCLRLSLSLSAVRCVLSSWTRAIAPSSATSKGR
jgi:hypothetical protein